MSRQPGQDYPDILLERYLAGDLGDDVRAGIERACERSEVLRQRLDQLRGDRDAFLAADPPQQFAHRLAARRDFDAEKQPRRRGWLAWLLAPSAVAAAAAVLVTLVMVDMSPEQSQLVGGAMDAMEEDAPATPAIAPVAAAAPAQPEAERPAAYGPAMRIAPERPPGATTPRSRRATSAKKRAKRRSGAAQGVGGAGGRVGRMDELLDARASTPAVPKPPPAEAPKGEAAPAAEPLMAAPADRGTRRLAKDDIATGVKKGSSAVMPCIKRARAKGELAAGRYTLILSWTIEPSGKVSSPRFVGPADLRSTSLPACFVRGMRTWRFPPSAGGAVRNFPFGPFAIE